MMGGEGVHTFPLFFTIFSPRRQASVRTNGVHRSPAQTSARAAAEGAMVSRVATAAIGKAPRATRACSNRRALGLHLDEKAEGVSVHLRLGDARCLASRTSLFFFR